MSHPLHAPVLEWYTECARDLPWRRPEASPWGVLVSEVMLQQTPVARVLPVWEQWLERWPTPADLAAAPAGDAVRAWGRLGYPRRALRLHAAAGAIVAEHEGQVPSSYADLLTLPGIGDYTAAAVASFAFGARHVVLDTNVRRVFARAVTGAEFPGSASPTRAEREAAGELLPPDRDGTGHSVAASWAVAVMELGALVCTARSPECDVCPIAAQCAWLAAGRPAYDGPVRRGQTWQGTDRMVRGRLLALVRAAPGSIRRSELDAAWPDDDQRLRCLESLIADGLLVPRAGRRIALPD